MNTDQHSGAPVAPEPVTAAKTVLDILDVITRHKRFIVWFVLVCTTGAIIIGLLQPKWYRSDASVFPAEKADLLGGLEGIASLAKNFSPTKALTGIGSNPETDRYLAILKSATVINAVIQKFDLVNVYGITSFPHEKTAKELLSNTDITVQNEGNLTITVYDKDPQRAADMANYYVELLNKTNSELGVQNARGNRLFIEERYDKNLADLAAAEDSLKAYQQRYGIIALPEQLEASIKAAAEITGRLALKEVQLGVLRRMQSADNPSAVETGVEIEELRHKLAQMSSGTDVPESQMKVFVPFSKAPQLGTEYVRRLRNVEIQYKILQFVSPLYEQAKVEERRETPSVLVLDKAVPAERKAKPKISLFGFLGLVVSLTTSLFIVFVLELISKLKAGHADRLNRIVSALRADWFGLRIRVKRR